MFTLWDAISAKLQEKKREKLNSWFSRREFADYNAKHLFEPFQYESTKKHKEEQVKQVHFKSRKVGLKPTKEQKKVLDKFFAGANHAYNLCVKLVKEHGVKPCMIDLQKIVSIQKKENIDGKYREANDDWFFQDIPSTV